MQAMSDILEMDHLAPSMRPPMWRWNLALKFMADPHLINSKMYSDPYLAEAIKFFRARDDMKEFPTIYARRYPAMYEANLINMCVLPTAFRWQVEALIMGGASNEEINKHFEFQCGADTVEFYRYMFFDVDSCLHLPGVVLGNILATAYVNTNGRDDFDFVWKAFAYNFKADAFMELLQQCGVIQNMPKNYLLWLEETKRNKLTYQSFLATLNYRGAYLDQALQVLTIASKNFQIDGNLNAHMSENVQQNLVMKSLDRFIQDKLSAPDLELRRQSVEPRLNLSYEDIATNYETIAIADANTA